MKMVEKNNRWCREQSQMILLLFMKTVLHHIVTKNMHKYDMLRKLTWLIKIDLRQKSHNNSKQVNIVFILHSSSSQWTLFIICSNSAYIYYVLQKAIQGERTRILILRLIPKSDFRSIANVSAIKEKDHYGTWYRVMVIYKVSS